MLIKILLVFFMFITTLSMSSCIRWHVYNVELSCDQFAEDSYHHSNVKMEVGDKIRLKLCSNQTTGFQWEYFLMTQENVLKKEDHYYEEPNNDVIGAAGVELWTFKAVEEGTVKVIMAYSQPWEGGTKSKWTYIITVTVE